MNVIVIEPKVHETSGLNPTSNPNPDHHCDFNQDQKDQTVFARPKMPNEKSGQTFAANTPELLAKHLKVTGGKIWTRFPPEPNGYLHLGHAKAMNFNFGQARLAGGQTYMRFDDTNPTAEKQEYIDSIMANITWLGNHPFKVTHSSDYFQELYELAVELIKRGKAYVCFQNREDGQASRKILRDAHITAAKAGARLATIPDSAASPWRDSSVADNLRLFEVICHSIIDPELCTPYPTRTITLLEPNLRTCVAV